MDPNLNALLDDALNDFDNVSLTDNQTAARGATGGGAGASGATGGKKEDDSVWYGGEHPFGEDIMKEFREEWFRTMEETNKDNPEVLAQFKQLRKDVANVTKRFAEDKSKPTSMKASTVRERSLEESMKETLEFLTKKTVPTENEEDFDKILQDLGTAGDMGDIGVMENLMKNMLSKEMLYPPMKEMCKEYPLWLEKNDAKLSENDRRNYKQQIWYLNKICSEFEAEKSTDSDKCKNERFMKIMELINGMQEFGQPPSDLMEGKQALPEPESCVVS